jgi:hypothetical protein
MQIENIRFEEQGVIIGLRDEKTSITRELVFTASPHSSRHRFCIPCALHRWVEILRSLNITQGPLFRPIDRWNRLGDAALTTQSITMLLRKRLAHIVTGAPTQYSSHSFRHGVVKTALTLGWSTQTIMQLTLHRSERGLQPYIEDYDVWRNSSHRSVLTESVQPENPEQGWNHGF